MLRTSLEGYRFILSTDDYALPCTVSFHEEMSELVYCRLKLLEYDFDNVYWAGLRHHATDDLTKTTDYRSKNAELED